MIYIKKLKNNIERDRVLSCFLFSFIPAFIFYFIAIAILSENGFKIKEILRDPAQQSGESSFLGFLSNIGIWLWVSSAAICFFSLQLKRSSENDFKEFLFLVGGMSLLLAIDDFFMIHDRFINQYICYLVYALFAFTLLIRHFNNILSVDIFSFIFAGLLLFLSILVDLTQGYLPVYLPVDYMTFQIFEECFKFIGASVWLYFSIKISSYKI